MDQLQDEFAAESPHLEVQIIGVNEIGHESQNQLMTAGRDLPWLQDLDIDSNGQSDVWDEAWGVEFRDVVIVDANNTRLGAFNLTSNSLATAENYSLLKETTTQVAENNPIWQNDVNPLDVNDDSIISPVGDVLTIVNELNNRQVTDLNGNLPVPAPVNPPPYLDVNGDYVCSPVGDVLSLINHLNGIPAGEGEGRSMVADAQSPEKVSQLPVELAGGYLPSRVASSPDSTETRGQLLPPLFIDDPIPAVPGSQGSSASHDRRTQELAVSTGNELPAEVEDLVSALAADLDALWSR